MNPLIQLKTTPPLLVTLALLCFGLLSGAQAVVPPPDGGYPNFTTAEGTKALQNVTTGSANTAVGWFSLGSVITGSFNTATGAGSLLFNTADENTAFGAAALLNNTSGTGNTATGAAALLNNTIGQDNTANGVFALESNTEGSENTATGTRALSSNSTGDTNTATGGGALFSNTTGNNNTATGFSTLSANMTGNGNTAIGRSALTITTGSGNTALGTNAGSALTSGNLNIDIGTDVIGITGESNTIRIGANLDDTPGASACHIGGIYNQSVDPGTASSMAIDASGKLGTTVSSRRFKHDIKPMDKASEAILALKPVTFHYKSDVKNTPCFGLIAEEVAGVNPDLVVRNKDGEIWSVRYDQVNAMLLNEFLKARRQIDAQQKQIDALTVGLQKVSAQLEASKPPPQVVNNNY
jgi:Chaperone of endosialidase